MCTRAGTIRCSMFRKKTFEVSFKGIVGTNVLAADCCHTNISNADDQNVTDMNDPSTHNKRILLLIRGKGVRLMPKNIPSFLVNLIYLEVSGTKIESFTVENFKGMMGLKIIKIVENYALETISVETFNNIPNLEILDLSKNNIKTTSVDDATQISGAIIFKDNLCANFVFESDSEDRMEEMKMLLFCCVTAEEGCCKLREKKVAN